MDKKKLRRVPMYIALAAALPIAIGACSSPGSSSSDPASSAQAGSGSTSGTQQSGFVQFALCMRQNGVTDFPDTSSGHFVLSKSIQSNPHFNSALQACEHLLGASGINSGNTAQQQALLNFAHCMQTSGVPNWPDPSSNGAFVAPQGVDQNSATFKNAYHKCESDLPNGAVG